MIKKLSLVSSLAGCLIALTACSSAAQTHSAGGGEPAAGATDSAPAGQAVEDPIVVRARAALRGAGIEDTTQLVSIDPVQWNDSSLGCPVPGMAYMQVITAGHVVRLATRGTTHEVHVAGEAAVVCGQQLSGSPKRPVQAVRASALETMVKQAREDLASKLSVSVDSIALLNALPFTWEDGSFGCREPQTGEPRTVAGYKLRLASGTNHYVYHTDFKTVFACPRIEIE